MESVAFFARYLNGWEDLTYLIENYKPLHDPCRLVKTDPIFNVTFDDTHSTAMKYGKCEVRGGKIYEKFVLYEKGSNVPSIVTLGGSTTSGFFRYLADGFTWPYLLSEKVEKMGWQVINGGMGKYSSNEELLMLITQVRRLKNPKLIISLSGLNDTIGFYLSPERYQSVHHPFYGGRVQRLLVEQKWIDSRHRATYFPNLLYFVHKVNNKYFPEKRTDPDTTSPIRKIPSAERWFLNVKAMHALAASIGADYVVFLQPTMAIDGPQSILPEDEASGDYQILQEYMQTNRAQKTRKHYPQLKSYCAELDYCYDISDIAPPIGDLYYDSLHHNEKGNRIITEEIFRILQREDKLEHRLNFTPPEPIASEKRIDGQGGNLPDDRQ